MPYSFLTSSILLSSDRQIEWSGIGFSGFKCAFNVASICSSSMFILEESLHEEGVYEIGGRNQGLLKAVMITRSNTWVWYKIHRKYSMLLRRRRWVWRLLSTWDNEWRYLYHFSLSSKETAEFGVERRGLFYGWLSSAKLHRVRALTLMLLKVPVTPSTAFSSLIIS